MFKIIANKLLNPKNKEDLDGRFWIQKLLLKKHLKSLKV
tara:strand:- start:1714 stop:1830 length:117 start_codon:yes stop_codon:yes gene_type:complete